MVNEQPLRIIVNGQSVATLMQMPGGEIELATGWLLTEGLIGSRDQITAMSYQLEGSSSERRNGDAASTREVETVDKVAASPFRPAAGVVRIRLTEDLSEAAKRYHATFSSCSLCGLEAIERWPKA